MSKGKRLLWFPGKPKPAVLLSRAQLRAKAQLWMSVFSVLYPFHWNSHSLKCIFIPFIEIAILAHSSKMSKITKKSSFLTPIEAKDTKQEFNIVKLGLFDGQKQSKSRALWLFCSNFWWMGPDDFDECDFPLNGHMTDFCHRYLHTYRNDYCKTGLTGKLCPNIYTSRTILSWNLKSFGFQNGKIDPETIMVQVLKKNKLKEIKVPWIAISLRKYEAEKHILKAIEVIRMAT